MNRISLIIILLVVSSVITYARDFCEWSYLVGPSNNPRAFIHTTAAEPHNFKPEQIEQLEKVARRERVREIPAENYKTLRVEIQNTLRANPQMEKSQKIELEAALELLNDPVIGPTVRGHNVEILHPIPWEYMPRGTVKNELAEFERRGFYIRKFYELDIELRCCIIEVSFSDQFQSMFRKKRRQLSRMLNRDGRYDFINPDKKKVILFTPRMRFKSPELANWGVKQASTMEELKKLVRRSMKRRE